MKRITIALEDGLYVKLVEYAAQKSKSTMSRFSLSESVRDIVASHLLDSATPGEVEVQPVGDV